MDLTILILKFVVLSQTITVAYMFSPSKLRQVPGTTTVDNGFLNVVARSLVDCASLCTQHNNCDIGCYDSETKECKLHDWNFVHLKDPMEDGQETSTVLIRRDLKLIRVRSFGGQAAAEAKCLAFGGEMSTYSQLSDAFYNHGLHMRECGLVTSGGFYYALQYLISGVGYQGINDCFWKSDGDVFWGRIHKAT